MSDDPNDAIVCLRLELHRVRDQFTMVSQVVEFERKENLRLRNEREALILEVASLKVEVERTGIQPEGSNDAVGRAVNVLLEKEKEIARLKAEVETLENRCDFLEGRNQQ